MDDFRLGPIPPYDAYRDRQPSNAGDRKRAKQPKDQAAGEDEILLAESGATGPQAEDGAGVEDYYSPSGATKASE
jgi:hypothetical protein